MSEIIFLLYTPHRSMPKNMPASFNLPGYGSLTIYPGENYRSAKHPDKIGNPVDVAAASYLLDNRADSISLADPNDAAKIEAFKKGPQQKNDLKARKRSRLEKEAQQESAQDQASVENSIQNQVQDPLKESNQTVDAVEEAAKNTEKPKKEGK